MDDRIVITDGFGGCLTPIAGTDAPAHVVLDIETMGTDPYSPVIAIGAVRFRFDDMPIHPDDIFYQAIKLESAMEMGLRPSASTIKWWMAQADAAKLAVIDDPAAMDLPNALDEFTQWWGSRPDEIWGNSSSFDCGLVKDAYKVCKKEAPWAFWRERCYRTMKSLPVAKDVEFVRIGTHRNALDDALSQMTHLRAIYKKLGLA